MTIDEALAHFTTGYALCKKLNITPTNFYKWKKNGFIPLKQQFLINKITGLDLPIDLDKKAMEERLRDNGDN